jgi:hypothetical protein
MPTKGTFVPLPERAAARHAVAVISGVIVHIENELPVKVDLEQMPSPTDLSITCTNVRTIDGKRPQFVHDKNSTFVFPMHVVRMIEAPEMSASSQVAVQEQPSYMSHQVEPEYDPIDEVAEEDLLARIRQI